MTTPTRNTIYAQIEAERGRQILQWGGSPHDDRHRRKTWLHIIGEHADRAAKSRGDSWRHRLVVIAAVCVAAIEAHDRKQERS
jgi:hypothetical protein